MLVWSGQEAGGAIKCSYEDEDGCKFYFTYRYKNQQFQGNDALLYDIYVQKEKQCPPPPPVLGKFVFKARKEELGLSTNEAELCCVESKANESTSVIGLCHIWWSGIAHKKILIESNI